VNGFDGSYDDNGDRSATISSSRITRVEYYVDGTTPNSAEYKIRTTNLAGHTQTDTIDATNGQVVSSVGPNQLETLYEYDALARPTKETRPDGTYTITSYEVPCIPSLETPVCDFIVSKQDFGSDDASLPATYVFYDKLLRETLSWKLGFAADDFVCIRKEYIATGPHAGRVDYETQPYPCLSPATAARVEFEYDIRGNLRRTTYPNGRIVSTSEAGITRLGRKVTTSVRGNGLNGILLQDKIAYFDSAGNLVKAIDDNDEAVRYIRNAYGTVVRTEHVSSSNVIQTSETVTATYDVMGNRLSLNDPDMGQWEYRYNAFGELKWQKDAKGQIKRLEYDNLGRVVTKTEPDHMSLGDVTTSWTYDEGNKAIGKLTRVCILRTAASCDLETSNGEEYAYDILGRPQTTTVKIEGYSYTTTINSYDNFSRVYEQTYPSSGSTSLRVRNEFNPQGYLVSVRDAASNAPFWTANDVNIFDQVEEETFGNGLVTYKTYNPDSHLIASISTGAQGRYQNYEYTFDSIGNLEQRIDTNEIVGGQRGTTERFYYDNLNRLTEARRNGSVYLSLQYSRNGNIQYKSDVGHYTYGENGAGPHAVTTVSGVPRTAGSGAIQPGDANADRLRDGHDVDLVSDIVLQRTGTPSQGQPNCDGAGAVDVKDVLCATDNAISGGYLGNKRYVYDANGNMIRGDGKIIHYTAFNKPFEIHNQKARLEFVYDANNSRTVQRAISPNGLRVTHYVGKLFNRVMDKDGNVTYENYIYAGGSLVAIKSFKDDGNVRTERLNFVHLDYLGSIDVITDEDGSIVAKYAYDPFGKRRTGQWGTTATNIIASSQLIQDVISGASPVGDRGFTGHEMLDNIGLIHMNGRVYDPNLGRFLSSDPFVQAPSDLQSFNRYTYVFNNPLAYTDPSGYLTFRDFLRGAVRSGLMAATAWAVGHFILMPMMTEVLMFPQAVGVFATGFVTGAIFGGNGIKGALISGVMAVAFMGVHNAGLESGSLQKIIAHGVLGGMTSAMQGGNFFEGMIGAAASQGLAPTINDITFMGSPGRIMAAAIVGGTASMIAGGKFENGATSAAFAWMFNEELGRRGRNARARQFAEAREARYRRGPGLYVTGHGVGVLGPDHLAIEYVPTDGSGASWVSAGPEDGLLVSGVDGARPTDIPSNNFTVGVITPPPGASVSQYYQSILSADSTYCDCVDYDLFPGVADSYNSNSYIHGLINATGGSVSVDLNNFVGGSKPLPPLYFGY
jgi:RHS repeat-associated protein